MNVCVCRTSLRANRCRCLVIRLLLSAQWHTHHLVTRHSLHYQLAVVTQRQQCSKWFIQHSHETCITSLPTMSLRWSSVYFTFTFCIILSNLGIHWRGFVRNVDVRHRTNQPTLSSIVKSRRLSFFGHLARMDENADASQMTSEPPPESWRRPPGWPHTS